MVRLGKGEGGREEEILNAPVSEVFRLVFFFFFLACRKQISNFPPRMGRAETPTAENRNSKIKCCLT